MVTKEILSLWEKYHTSLRLYRNRPPEYVQCNIPDPKVSFCNFKKEMEEFRRNIQKNQEIGEIIYMIQNEERIERIRGVLRDVFFFSDEEIENNISIYDALFSLSASEAKEKIEYFLDLFETRENFLMALRVGAPCTPDFEEERWLSCGKAFLGIMAYKRLHIFRDKLQVLIDTLEMPKKDAATLFVSSSFCMYHSAKVIYTTIDKLCQLLHTNPRFLGGALKKCPALFLEKESDIEDVIQSLKKVYSLQEDEAATLVLRNPEIISNPCSFIESEAKRPENELPRIIREYPWLYRISEVIVKYYDGYGYGDYKSIVNFIRQLQELFGKIVDVQFRCMNPMTKEGVRDEGTLLYTVLILQVPNDEDSHCFISLGSGLGTYQYVSKCTPETKFLYSVFGGWPRAEFYVKAPSRNSEEYSEMLDIVFLMAATGNTAGCALDLTNGKSAVVEEFDIEVAKHIKMTGIDFFLHTIVVMPTEDIAKKGKK